MDYQTFKNGVLGQVIGDGECVSLVVNNDRAYAENLFPGVTWTNMISPVEGARQLLGAANGQYFQAVQNDHNDPNQLPPVGAVLVFDATPQAGYTNGFNNPYGHTGLCDSADANGYTILQQNSPTSGAAVNLKWYPWNFRPCLGWLIPVVPTPQETPNVQETTPAPTSETPAATPDPTPVEAPQVPADPVTPSTPVEVSAPEVPQAAPTVAAQDPQPVTVPESAPEPTKTNTPPSGNQASPAAPGTPVKDVLGIGPEVPETLWQRIIAWLAKLLGISNL